MESERKIQKAMPTPNAYHTYVCMYVRINSDVRFYICIYLLGWVVCIYLSRHIREGAAEASQILLRDAHVPPKPLILPISKLPEEQ
jgi:hypothetical protein